MPEETINVMRSKFEKMKEKLTLRDREVKKAFYHMQGNKTFMHSSLRVFSVLYSIGISVYQLLVDFDEYRVTYPELASAYPAGDIKGVD